MRLDEWSDFLHPFIWSLLSPFSAFAVDPTKNQQMCMKCCANLRKYAAEGSIQGIKHELYMGI
jgi:hypothetical protein